MINAYDQPAQYQAADTYVPIPFQEIMAAGMQKQRQYEEAENLTNKTFEDLESQSGLKYINAPGSNTPIEVGDYQRVEDRKKYYTGVIDELVMNTPDKGSPMYRSKITNVIRQLRKDLSPEGTFGAARANYSTYSEMMKNIRESEDAANNPFLLQGKRQELLDFAKRSKEGVAQLSNMATIGKDPELNKQLVDVLDNMKANLSTQLDADLANGVIRKDEYEGIAYNKAYQNALNTIMTTPSIYNSLGQQAAWEKDVYGRDTNPEQAAKNLAANMANVFAYGKSTKDIKLDSGWATMQKENAPTGMELPINYNIPGTGIGSYSGIEQAVDTNITALKEADVTIAQYDAALLKNPNATVTDEATGQPIALKDLREKAVVARDVANEKLQEVRTFQQQADRFGGLTEDQISETDKAKAQQAAAKDYTSKIRQSFETETEEGKQQYINENWKIFLPNFREKAKARDKFIKDAEKVRTTNTNIIIPSKAEISTYDADGFKTLALKGNLKYAETTDGKTGEMELDEKEKIDPTKSVFLGRGVSKDDGNFEYFYSTYDKDGNKVADVRVSGSKLDELNLAGKGQLELPGQGLRGIGDRVRTVTSNKSGYGDMEFNSSTGKSLKVTVAKPSSEGGAYRVLLPKADGTKQVQEFPDEQSMHVYIYNLEQNLKNK